MTHKVTRRIVNVSSYHVPKNLNQTIAYLESVLESIPEDMREQATIEFEGDYDYSSGVEMTIMGVRDETEPERLERQERDAHVKGMAITIRQQQERQLYEELKRKYG